MLLLLITVGFINVAEARGCLPLPRKTATFEYYTYAGDRHVDGNPAVRNSFGRYPHGTHAKRFCKDSDEIRKPGLFVAVCVKFRWVYYKDVKPCPDFRCQPLTPNETISDYEYLREITNSGGKNYEVVEPDADGKYPELTYIRRTCNGFPKDSRLQNKDIAGFCHKAEWEFYFLPTCPTPGSCYDGDISTKLKFHGYSYDYKTAEVDFVFLNDRSCYFLEFSEVKGNCEGYQVSLWCHDGEWLGSGGTISCDMFRAQ